MNVIKENLEDTELRSNLRNSQQVKVKVKVKHTKDQTLILISIDPTLEHWIVDVDCSEFRSLSLKTQNPLKTKILLAFLDVSVTLC